VSEHGTAKWLLLAQPDPANKSDQRSVRHEAALLPAAVTVDEAPESVCVSDGNDQARFTQLF
jgi:hypothetical protein